MKDAPEVPEDFDMIYKMLKVKKQIYSPIPKLNKTTLFWMS
jgi:hypothetical protein